MAAHSNMAEMSNVELLRKYDLTQTLAKYLDKHGYMHLLTRLREVNQEIPVYSENSLFEAEMSVLKKTNLVGYLVGRYQEFKGCSEEEVPAELLQQRDSVVENVTKKLAELQEAAKPFFDVFWPNQDAEQGFLAFAELNPPEGEKRYNLEYLNKEYGITKAHFESVYQYAKIQYETGEYNEAQLLLHYYNAMGDLDHKTEALWGELAAAVQVHDWGAALDTMKQLQDHIEKGVPEVYATPGAQLQARAWLMHWALFIFFFYSGMTEDKSGEMSEEPVPLDDGLDKLVREWLPDERQEKQDKEGSTPQKFMRVIQTICPHLVRYVAVAVIVGQEKTGRRSSTGQDTGRVKMKLRNKDLTRLVDREEPYYTDPITRFVKKLYCECDLEGAHQMLAQCELIMDSDFFLQGHKERFVRQAREMIFENYCRIHSVMDIEMVAKKLGLDIDDTERYIVKMIRGAQLDAKIDSEANQVLLAPQGSSFYREIRRKTKEIRDKTDELIERLQDRRPHEESEEKKEEEKKAPVQHAPPQPSQPRGTMRDFSRAM